MKKTDSDLQRYVMAELEWDPSVDHSEIGAAAVDGVVSLIGFVGSYDAAGVTIRMGAGNVIFGGGARGPGVVQVDGHIVVLP